MSSNPELWPRFTNSHADHFERDRFPQIVGTPADKIHFWPPQEAPATDEQRQTMRELSAFIPQVLRENKYWTQEEINDPRMTYKEAERGIAYLQGARTRKHLPGDYISRGPRDRHGRPLN